MLWELGERILVCSEALLISLPPEYCKPVHVVYVLLFCHTQQIVRTYDAAANPVCGLLDNRGINR